MTCKNLVEIQQLTDVKQTYLITVAILEGRYYVWPDMDSIVIVKALGKKKKTSVVKNSDCPYYNEYFTFDKKITLHEFLNSEVVVEVVQPKSFCRKRKILGSFRLDVATIWAEPDHHFYKKWAVLSAPSDKEGSGSRGFLKMNLAVITKHISPALPRIQDDNEIEGNLLLPRSKLSERIKAKFEFDIFKAEHIYDKKRPPSSRVEVSFGGNIGKTSVRKHSSFPEFNERIIIQDMFPLLCQRIRISIYFGSMLYAEDYLPMSYITNEDLLFPNFGPAFLHLYDEGAMECYKGSILLSMRTRTEAISVEDKKRIEVVPISSTAVINFPKLVFKFFLIIFECSALDKRFEGKVHFRVASGNISEKEETKSVSDKFDVRKINRNSFYIDIGERKPLLTLEASLYDFRKRLYNMNMLQKIYGDLDKELIDLDSLFKEGDITLNEQITEGLLKCLDKFRFSTQKYIDIVGNYDFSCLTELGRGKLEQNLKLMKKLMTKAEKIFDPSALRKTFMKTRKLCDRLFCVFNQINDMWPDIFITTWKGNNQLAYSRLRCEDVLFSQVEEERGKMCGKVTTIYLQPEKRKIPKAKYFTNTVGKMEVLLWMGMEKSYMEVLKSLPGGYEMTEDQTSPHPHVSSTEIHTFQCRCHLFQGRIRPGNDASGLSDTIVRIHYGDDCQESRIENETLNPVWNQTLIFKKIIQYGDINFIKENPPTMVIELFDRDDLFTWEFIGRTVTKPLVKTKEEPYAPPRFPPKLQWFKVYNENFVSADILAAFEMLEITGEHEDQEEAEKDIISIPEDIKPELVSFRMEVYFWGLRNFKRSKFGIKTPKISIECGQMIVFSDGLKDKKNVNNFTNPIKSIDLQLPSLLDYASPLVIRMTDSKLYFSTFVGIYIKHVKFFFLVPLTEEQKKNYLSGVTPYNPLVYIPEDKSSEDSNVSLEEAKPRMVFNPKNCFCRTSEIHKLAEKGSKIRCFCRKTRWQKFRQAFSKKKIYCPCLKEYQQNVAKVERKHRKTCACCRKLLRKLHIVTGEGDNKPGFWDLLSGVFRSSCSGNRCECCRKVAGKIREICGDTAKRCGFCERISQRFWKKGAKKEELSNDSYEDSNYDWWTKFFSSLKLDSKSGNFLSVREKFKLTIYPRELELQSEFEKFKDILMGFPLYKGKRTGDEIADRDMVQGIFKGNIKIYRWPEQTGPELLNGNGSPLRLGYFSSFPSNERLYFTLRVYCVRALHLPPKDLNGKCDPYLYLILDEQIQNDVDNYKESDLNPVFGRMFEFHGYFPRDHTLTLQVWDRDLTSTDDLIGETVIDIENRMYTNHRAKCGLPEHYKETGYCAWRDQEKPTVILGHLCKNWNLPKPVYAATSVRVGAKVFESPTYESSGDDRIDKEMKALYALRNWHQLPFAGMKLVPEHVETRSLYNPENALVEQGKIQMWIDIFPSGEMPPPNPVDITVKPPEDYELRVVIWNTADVLLQEDEFFTGQKKSDILVKGMLLGHDNIQSTDVHYRSLTGEGNFNWRFIFPMKYLPNEDMTLVRTKEGLFQSRDTDKKYPCRITLQVWENDTFSSDDFLGTVSMDLSRLPKGAKGPESCNFSIMEPNVPRINLFRIKRTRGWWPMKGKDLDDNLTLVGKVEAEFELLTSEEASRDPAGFGRTAPQSLPEPKRPKTSFNWFTNPLKSMRFVVWKHYKWSMVKGCCCVLFLFFIGLAIYALPGYSVKKILGV